MRRRYDNDCDARREAPSDLLHRVFPLPTVKPRWRQPLLQCDMKAGKRRLASRYPVHDRMLPLLQIGDRVIGDEDGTLKDLREKLLGHLRETANKLRIKMPLIGPAVLASEKAGEPKLEPAPSSGAGEAGRPWNLRLGTTARRTSAAPVAPPVASPAKNLERTACRSANSEKKKKWRFSISLLQKEIEQDLFALTGSRPPRRPKKRPRSVQWQLDTLFPGLSLPEIKPKLYDFFE